MSYRGIVPDGDRVEGAVLTFLQVKAKPGQSHHIARGASDDPSE